jgi:16S rRNA G1207 methylase RsmC
MEILHRLVMESPRYLTPDGALYLVMQHRLNLQPLLQTAFANAELLASNGSYKLWRGSKTAV